MATLKLLDLFCGAGGASVGYHLAGFDVTGVDWEWQPHYPFPHQFACGDALTYLAKWGHEFDCIHASPPCQAHTSLRTMHNAKAHLDLIPATRAALKATGKPYVIENVVGAPLVEPFVLCGSMFGLGVDDAELRRHRLFESNVFMIAPSCQHGERAQCLGVYGGHVRNRRRRLESTDRGIADFTVEQGHAAMQIDWMTVEELSQAIPPAYTKFIGERLIGALS